LVLGDAEHAVFSSLRHRTILLSGMANTHDCFSRPSVGTNEMKSYLELVEVAIVVKFLGYCYIPCSSVGCLILLRQPACSLREISSGWDRQSITVAALEYEVYAMKEEKEDMRAGNPFRLAHVSLSLRSKSIKISRGICGIFRAIRGQTVKFRHNRRRRQAIYYVMASSVAVVFVLFMFTIAPYILSSVNPSVQIPSHVWRFIVTSAAYRRAQNL
jgi:hypothetical protein